KNQPSQFALVRKPVSIFRPASHAVATNPVAAGVSPALQLPQFITRTAEVCDKMRSDSGRALRPLSAHSRCCGRALFLSGTLPLLPSSCLPRSEERRVGKEW